MNQPTDSLEAQAQERAQKIVGYCANCPPFSRTGERCGRCHELISGFAAALLDFRQAGVDPLLYTSDKQAVGWKERALAAEKERDAWKEKAEARQRHIEMHMHAQGQRSLIQQRTALVARAEAAESALREATEREEVLHEALEKIACSNGLVAIGVIPTDMWGDELKARMALALAALTSIKEEK